jgi:hypothetical protein
MGVKCYEEVEICCIIVLGGIMSKKIWQRIDKILLGSITVLFLIGFNLIDSTIGTDVTVGIWIVKVILMISFLIIIVLYAIFSISKEELLDKDIKVFKIDIDKGIKIIYIKPNDKVNLNDIVTVYVSDGETEKLVGIGYVINIQQKNKLIQIEMISQKNDKKLIELCKNWQDVIVKKEMSYKVLNELIELSNKGVE